MQHDNEKFSAQDKDNDNTDDLNCAISYRGNISFGLCMSLQLASKEILTSYLLPGYSGPS